MVGPIFVAPEVAYERRQGVEIPWGQCYQLAEISASLHISGCIQISAGGNLHGQIFEDVLKKGRKVAELF
jgi:hypothetical protein